MMTPFRQQVEVHMPGPSGFYGSTAASGAAAANATQTYRRTLPGQNPLRHAGF